MLGSEPAPDARLTELIHSLAVALGGMGKFELAERRLRGVYEGFCRELGDSHKRTIATRKNIAVNLYQQGKVEDAVRESQFVLEDYQRTQGVDSKLMQNVFLSYNLYLFPFSS